MDQTTWQLVGSAIAGGLGGGFLGTVLGWMRDGERDRKQRQIEYLNDQLSNLYAPLLFYAEQNELLSITNDKNLQAHKTAYIEPNWSQEYHTQETVSKESDQAIDLINSYWAKITQNNAKMVQLIETQYRLVDDSDRPDFQQFVMHWIRSQTERVDGKWVVPGRMARLLPPIMSYEYDFVFRIKKAYKDKSSALATHRKVSRIRLWGAHRTAATIAPASSKAEKPVPELDTGPTA